VSEPTVVMVTVQIYTFHLILIEKITRQLTMW